MLSRGWGRLRRNLSLWCCTCLGRSPRSVEPGLPGAEALLWRKLPAWILPSWRRLVFPGRGPAAPQAAGESPLGPPSPVSRRMLPVSRGDSVPGTGWASGTGTVGVPGAPSPQAVRMVMESSRTAIMVMEGSGTAMRWRIFPPFSQWAVVSPLVFYVLSLRVGFDAGDVVRWRKG